MDGGGLGDTMLPQQQGSLSGVLAQALSLFRAVLSWLRSRFLPHIVTVGPLRGLRLVRLIAEGSSGYVWLASEVGTARTFAVKQVLAQSMESRTALRKEVESHELFSADRRHPNLMPLIGYTFDKTGTGETGYLVFPLMGRSLQDVINDAGPVGTGRPARAHPPPFSEAACLHIARGLASALDALHKAGRTHRDVCPRNVLLDEVGEGGRGGGGGGGGRDARGLAHPRPVLSDFGSMAPAWLSVGSRADAARVVDEASQHSSPPYRAPELWHCEPGAEMGPPVDAFALGCTLFACAFGLSPFESTRGSDGRLRVTDPSHTRVLNDVQFPSVHPFSHAFCELLLALCGREPAHRPTMQEVQSRVDGMLRAGEGGGAGEGADASV